MLICHEKNTGLYHYMKKRNKSFKSVEHCKYLETTLTNQIELMECLLPFGAESFILRFSI